MKNILILISLLTILSCGTYGKVSDRQDNGMFKASKEAQTIVSIPFDLDSHKNLLVVQYGDKDYWKDMVKNIMFFDRVIDWNDFEKEMVKDGKAEEIGSLDGRIAFANVYKKYKPFLYLSYIYNYNNSKYSRLQLINPKTAEELFIAEIQLDVIWAGATDENNRNPLYNEFIKYIKLNSKSYEDATK